MAQSGHVVARRLWATLRSVANRSVIVAVVAAVALFFNLNDRDLWASHEARAAQNAIGFLETGHWGLLRLLDGTPEYQKPPLYYWLVAGVAVVRGGVDAWAVRLPAAFSGWITIVAVMVWLTRRGRPLAGQLAGLALLSSHHFLSTCRTGRIDAALMACVTLAVLFAIEGHAIAAGIALAAALLLKGPVGIVLAGAVCCLVSCDPTALRRGALGHASAPLRRASGSRLTAMIAIAIAIAAPWFLYVSYETHGEFASVFFWYHNLQRATGSAELASHPFWFYPARWAIDFLPGTLLLIPALLFARPRDRERWLGLVGVVAITGLLSLSRFKRADYLLPAYPFAAILIGGAFERRPRFVAVATALSLTAFLAFEAFVLPGLDRAQEKHSFAAAIRSEAGEAPIIFFRVEDHLLGYHLGKPLMAVKEWENLDIWVGRLDPGYILMPAEEVAAWPEHLTNGKLHEVARRDDGVERPRPRSWVLMKSQPCR